MLLTSIVGVLQRTISSMACCNSKVTKGSKSTLGFLRTLKEIIKVLLSLTALVKR
ncbi:hypothetical protein JRQ81_014364 [Phrynocephalus forsythii]|uniref:Uncharacterized protein n=1 Tax=Phrynocephalus forsythii TaxID=171643 RepID=A0A9Q0XWJ2_9SAUR|nr:hypothetical protein JRQ81_014364 [Phrynocephalus forsythii]